MKLKDLMEKYGEREIKDIDFEKAFKELDEDVNSVAVLIEVLKKKPNTVWGLKEGDIYFVLYTDGDTADYEWKRDGGISKGYRDQGNVFRTKEEAKKEAERRAVEALLLKYGGRRWFKKNGENWILYLDEHNQATRYAVGEPFQGFIYFDSHEEAVNACEQIGNKRIVDALFEVR